MKVHLFYCFLFLMSSCRNNYSENYIGYLESCVPDQNISHAALKELVFVQLPEQGFSDVNEDDNYSDFVFVDVMIPADWSPDSSMTLETKKAYIAFEMASHINCCNDKNIIPCYSHFEDYFGLKPYGLLHLTFLRSEFEECESPLAYYHDENYSHSINSFRIHKND